jgi:hypothetical protein
MLLINNRYMMYAFCASMSVFLVTPQETTRLYGTSLTPFIFSILLAYMYVKQQFSINLYIFFIVLLFFVNLMVNQQLHDTINTGILFLLYYNLYLFISKSSQNDIRALLVTLTIIGVANFFSTTSEVYTGENIFGISSSSTSNSNRYYFEHTRARASFGGPITFGVFQLLCLYSAIKLNSRLSKIAIVLIFISVLYTQSYTALLFAVIYLCRNKLFVLLSATIGFGLFFHDKFSVGSIFIRINNIEEAIAGIMSMDIVNLLFGYGLGTARYLNLQHLVAHKLPDYNDFTFYLLTIYEFGIVGLLSFISGIIYFIYKHCYTKDHVILVLLILICILTFDYFTYFWIFAILLGLVKNESVYLKTHNYYKKLNDSINVL